MTETQTSPVWTVATDEESQWIVRLGKLWGTSVTKGWEFVDELRAGIDEHSKRRSKSELYDAVYNETGIGTKRLQNLVSMSRNPNSQIARDMNLEFAYAEAVLGLPDDHAERLLLEAAEQGLSATAIGARIREERQRNTAAANVPDAGNQRSINDDVVGADDVPFEHKGSSILYEEADDYSAEAEAYAGDADGYEYEPDNLELTLNEAREMVDAAWQRLARVDVGHPYTLAEWLRMVGVHAY